MLKRIKSALELLFNPNALKGLITWPVFSITSFNMLQQLKREKILPRTIIDVGANVGQFSVAAAKILQPENIFAFEPVQKCCDRLREHTRAMPGITIFEHALGSHSGDMPFYVHEYTHASSALVASAEHTQAFPHVRAAKRENVLVKTLDDALANATIHQPCLLKLDVQGFEAEVIKGGGEILKRCTYVVVESSFKSMYEGEPLFLDIVKLLSAAKFEFSRPVSFLSHPLTGEILQMDALFFRKR